MIWAKTVVGAKRKPERSRGASSEAIAFVHFETSCSLH